MMELLQKNLSDAKLIAVVGIGNELRGDDAAGVLVAEELKESRRKKILAINGGPAPENFTGEIIRAKPTHVVFVDATWMELPPGEIRVVAPEAIDNASFSTHTLPVNVLISYLVQSIGCKVLTIGIQPLQTEFAAPMTREVKRAALDVARMLCAL